jgi:NAD(P)-dependent dehydrogenase (short-subunit alcohol dehydrogenase family)
MHQEPLSADGLASEEHDMGADTRTAGGLTGQVLEVIHHPDDRFYELLADGQFAGLIVYEDARPPWRLGVSGFPRRRHPVTRLDLGDLASVREFAASWPGALHVLVNNAGAGGREGGCADG